MRRFSFLAGLIVFNAAALLRGEPVTPAGAEIAHDLDAMDVEHHWIAGVGIDWRTGERIPDEKQHATHCSAFAAAFCDKLGVYLLHPPEHGQTFLANAQQDWLRTKGAEQGWKVVDGPVEAQRLANQGLIVLVTYKNPNPKKSGHIAVVRPADLSVDAIKLDGPEEAQAGQYNHNATVVREGFKVHKGAFETGALVYFAHAAPVTK